METARGLEAPVRLRAEEGQRPVQGFRTRQGSQPHGVKVLGSSDISSDSCLKNKTAEQIVY